MKQVMMSFFKGFIEKRVDERINEILKSGGDFNLRELSDKKAKEEITSFILENKERGVKQLSTLDFVLNLKLPAEQVNRILEVFKKQKQLKEVNA